MRSGCENRLVCIVGDCWNEACRFISHITMTSFPGNFQATISLIIKQRPTVWVSIFPWAQQNTLHFTPEIVIPLLCYVVTQNLEAPGVRRVCFQMLHANTLAYRHTSKQHTIQLFFLCFHSPLKNNSLAISHKWPEDQLHCGTLKLTVVHCSHNTYPLLTINTHCTNPTNLRSVLLGSPALSSFNAAQTPKQKLTIFLWQNVIQYLGRGSLVNLLNQNMKTILRMTEYYDPTPKRQKNPKRNSRPTYQFFPHVLPIGLTSDLEEFTKKKKKNASNIVNPYCVPYS